MSVSSKRSISQIFFDSGKVVKLGLRILKKNPQVAAYPYMAFLFIIFSFPTINALVFAIWNRWSPESIISINNTPRTLRVILGLVSFSVFYTALVTSYFTAAASAEALAKLEDGPTTLFFGIQQVVSRFLRISWFALSAVFFFPLGLIAQRRKLFKSPRSFIEVIGSAYTLHMPQLAPVIISKSNSVMGSIRLSIKTLGEAWREGLIIRLGMFVAFLFVSSLGFLPKLVEHYWFSGETAHLVSWLVSIFIWSTGYVTIKVLGTVFTTTLYYQAANKKYGRGERT